MADLIGLSDAIADDIAANVSGLPNFRDWRYLRPRFLTTDLAPHTLAVFPEDETYDVALTDRFAEERPTMVVMWAADHGNYQDGESDQQTAKRELAHIQNIRDQLHTYMTGVPNVASTYAVVSRVSIGLAQGHIYRAELRLNVERLT